MLVRPNIHTLPSAREKQQQSIAAVHELRELGELTVLVMSNLYTFPPDTKTEHQANAVVDELYDLDELTGFFL